MSNLDASSSIIIRSLLAMRGISQKTASGIQGWKDMGFEILEHQHNKEIILGLIGQFWKTNGNIQRFAPENFLSFHDKRFAKATWSFEITSNTNNSMKLETETRIFCMDEIVRKKFARYWFLIKPFSALIRIEMLKVIKKKAEEIKT